MSNHDEQDLLAQELRRRSTGVGGQPIGLDDVRDRARSIRRRRTTVRGVVAAMVAAVAVPAGLTLGDSLGTPDSAPRPSASGTESPSPDAPTPRPDGTFPLTVRDLPEGQPSPVRYVLNEERRLMTLGGAIGLDESYSMITPYAGGWLALGSGRQGHDLVMLDGEMNETRRTPGASDGLVTNEEGTRVAYAERRSPDEMLLVVAPTDGTDPVTWPVPLQVPGGMFEPIGFLDDETVVFETTREEQYIGIATVGGEVTELGGFINVTDASSADGLIAGAVSYDNTTGSCSGVMDAATRTFLWQACDLTLGAFSPDGRFLIAYPGYYDGFGPASLMVLDAHTGDKLLEFSPERGGQTVVGVVQATWEDEDTVLAHVMEGNDEAVVRAEFDGRLERVSDVYESSDMALRLWFADAPRR